MQLGIYEIFERIQKLRKTEEKIQYLKYRDSIPLRQFSKIIIDDRIEVMGGLFSEDGEFLIEVNCTQDVMPTRFLSLMKNFKIIFEPCVYPNMKKSRRELILQSLLEEIHVKDLPYAISMLQQKTPPGVTVNTLRKAFPGLRDMRLERVFP